MTCPSILQPDISFCQRHPRSTSKRHRHGYPNKMCTENIHYELTANSHQGITYPLRSQRFYSLRCLQLILLVIVPLLVSLQFASCMGVPLQSNDLHKKSLSTFHHPQPELLLPASSETLDFEEGLNEEHLRERRSFVDVVSNPFSKWDNATVPFVFDKLLPLRLKRQAVKAMCYWMKNTNCITFVERTTEPYFVRFEYLDNSNGCVSFVGRVRYSIYYPAGAPPSGQPVKLSLSCNRGKIMHELGHALGFYHEHLRPDRDQYILINNASVKEGFQNKFVKLDPDKVLTLGSYDYGSIMHYPLTAFSKDGSKTMIPKLNYTGTIGQRKRLTRMDKTKANNFYQCVDRGGNDNRMPDNVDIIKHENWIILTPLNLNYPQDRLMCNSERCSVSDCAGKLFKHDDAMKCPDLLISIHKISSNKVDKIIRIGDKVSLRWELPEAEGSTVTSSSTRFGSLLCSVGAPCTLSEACASTNVNGCPGQVFIVRVHGKNTTDKLMHLDQVVFERQVIGDDGETISVKSFTCQQQSDGPTTCSIVDNCFHNDFGNVECNNNNPDALFHLQKI